MYSVSISYPLSIHLQIILMSATIDSKLFANYFSLPIGDTLHPAPVLEVKGKTYRVTEFYADDLEELGYVCSLSLNLLSFLVLRCIILFNTTNGNYEWFDDI